MWRIVIPLVEFVVDCLLSLAVFALVTALLCGLWESERWRRSKQPESFTA